MGWHHTVFLLLNLCYFGHTFAFFDFLSTRDCTHPDDLICDSGKCVSRNKRCDGIADCLDATDEFDCDKYLCREPNYFRCDKRRCISAAFVCDSDNDCEDFSDEKNCTTFKVTSSQNCTEDEWMCNDRLCIPKEWVCNDEPDCLDGSDETLGCSMHLDCDGFQCHNGHCIPLEWHCDGHADCLDGSDELACEYISLPQDCAVDNRKFLCKNNKTCIDFTLMCDGTPHCPDKSDENPKCTAADQSCNNHNCSHECVQTPSGPLCLCPVGYHQLADKRCADINECDIFGICDQKCKNTAGSYTCYCDEKYLLQEDKRTCRAEGGEAVMFFSSKTEIRAYFLTSQIYYSVATKLKQVVGVSFDGHHLYWTDIQAESESIVRAEEDGSNRELLVTSGLGAPEDLAVDWITGNIYFTDADMQHIGVCTNDALRCTILVNEDISKPRGIVLNPAAGEMFWSDWGNTPEIARSNMDGTDDVSFVSDDIRWPNGLTIDYPNQRLYWVDAKLSKIESILLDGTDRKVVLSEVVKHPYAIAVFEDKLYWSDWATHSIQYCDKFTGKNHHTFIKEKKDYIYGIHIFHSALKHSSHNPCKEAFCSDICLLKGSTYSCACPPDKVLTEDKHNCHQSEKKQMMAIGAKDMLMLISHQNLGKHEINALPVGFSQINYLAYDSLEGAIIVSDKHLKKIFSVNMKTKDSKTLVSTGIGEIGGMDFDYFTNNLYWCDTKLSTVEILSLNTNERKVIMRNLEDEIPLDLALIPEEGVMFVAFKKPEDGVHIDRIHMDGLGGRTHVVEQGVVGPVTLVYDPDLKRIFWSDTHTGNIESTSVDGDDRHGFRSLVTEPVSISVLGKDLFWTNKKSRRIYWANKLNTGYGLNKKITLDVSKNLEAMYLTVISGVRTELHPCLKDNGGCSHLCLQSLKEPICTCPLGQSLTSDNRTCFAPKHCAPNEFKCDQTEICIPKSLRCNGKKECINGDDEENCVKERRCSFSQFECSNGQCIPKDKVCDLHYDCRDNSDEMNCHELEMGQKPKCPSGSFQCKDGKCIGERLVCDTIQDCDDGTDEEDCHPLSCTAYEFRCNSDECIPKSWECDHEVDCRDGSDEHEYCSPKTCSPDTFTCDNGRCIDQKLHCNFMDDCGDLSDEFGCNTDAAKVHECPEFEFLCNFNSTTCLPESARCNGTVECPNGEDEKFCKNCKSEEFECKNKKCIAKTWVCDKRDDCGDKSDEDTELCIHGFMNQSEVVYEQHAHVPCEHGFRCKTGHCIDQHLVCDGVENCYDGSDEFGSCDTACEINNNPCSSVCLKTPSGPKCSCEEGYTLKGDAQNCQDVNECDEHPQPCSQLCENTAGSFICTCFPGYILRTDKKSCKAVGSPMYIIFSSSNEIRRLSPAINTLDLIFSEDSPRISGLDVSVQAGNIYFSMEKMGSIHRVSLATNEKDYVIGLGQPQKLAVDWITENVYFVDSGNMVKSIRVCHLLEQKCAKILELNVHEQVSSVVVDAVNKYLFYATTSWWLFNSPSSVIYKCNLDGSKVQEIVKKDLGYVTGLAVDYNKKQLYFSDQHLNQIQSVDYDGNSRHIVLSNPYVHHPMSLSLFEDHVYFLTPNGYMVKCKIYSTQKICSLLRLHAYNTEMFVLAQESKQPSHENVCVGHNCTHLCIQSEIGVLCVCEDGKSVSEGVVCETKKKSTVNGEENPVLTFEINSSRRVFIGKKSNSSAGSIISAVIITVLIAVCAVLVYKHIRSKKTGNFDVSMRFQNPAYGLTVPDSGAGHNNLSPGQHEYTNPVLINTRDMETAANVILQKAKQNPFVLADSSHSDSDSKKLINF